MKKSLFIAAALLTLAACTREMDVNTPAGNVIITAKTETAPETKTVVEGETHVYWEPGDEIKVFAGGKSGKFTTDITSSAATAEFKGTLSVSEGADIWAVYPYSEDAVYSDGTITTVLPAQQVARAGSFGKDMNLAVAHSTTSDTQFYNVCGGVRFTLSQDGITEVVLEGLKGEILAGKVKVGFQDGKPAIQEVTDGKTAITITPPDGEAFTKNAWYYIVAIPGALEDGFTFHFRKASDPGLVLPSSVYPKTVSIKRSVYGVLTYVDKGMDQTVPEEAITFRDPLVKSIVVKYFDTDNDGELSFHEAAVVLSFLVDETETRADDGRVSIFAGTGITSFDEMVYFTGLTRIDNGAFAGCTELTSVTIPENVESIGDNAFNGCTGLESITITAATPPAIGEDAFANTGDCPILVPEEAVEQYLSSWSEYAPRIQASPIPCPEAVDLGLSVKWASFNLGATSPEESGDYYAWGETTPKEAFTWADYQWCDGAEELINKYLDYRGDNRYNLEAEDDAAFVKLGGEWRTPTVAERNELYEYCTFTQETVQGVTVLKATSKINGNFIYFPLTGWYSDAGYSSSGTATFWTSSLARNKTIAGSGFMMSFNWSTSLVDGAHSRYAGFPIRPVSGGFGVPVEDFRLENTELELMAGESATLSAVVSPEDATLKGVSWMSYNTSIAKVSSSGEVTGVAEGKTTIMATTWDGGLTAYCSVTVLPPYSVAVPEAIDLGLSSGVKWASFNLGATKPEEYGDYFAWGETEPYYRSLDPLTWKSGKESGYVWPSYNWSMGSKETLTKYCDYAEYGFNGFTDNKVALDPEDDAASVLLGEDWRMPTKAEQDELRECTWEWTSVNSVSGYKVTGPNGNSIFLPAAGLRDATDLVQVGTSGHYWSSSLFFPGYPEEGYQDYPDDASLLCLDSRTRYWFRDGRCYGFSIRPVFYDSNPPEQGVVFWENDGTHGDPTWSQVYRFALEGMDTEGLALASFPENVWNIIKTRTFYLVFEVNDTSPLYIQVTAGDWSRSWNNGGISSLDNQRVTPYGDNLYRLDLNFSDDPDFVQVLDEKFLMFTGIGYTPLKLSY